MALAQQSKIYSPFSFEKVSQIHLSLLFSWLNSSHLKGVYENGCSSLEEVESKYLSDKKGVDRFIVSQEDQPFGFIQSYRIDAFHILAKSRHPEGLTAGIDLFIGQPSFLGKGYGFEMLRQFIASLEKSIERVIVDPLQSNTISKSLFSKYGFQQMEEISIEGRMHDILGINMRRAARGILLNPQGQILLIQMKADPQKKGQSNISDFWLTPGGKVEPYESEKQALAREVKEETGLTKISIDKVLFSDERTEFWHGFPLRLFNQYYLVRAEEWNFSSQYLTEEERGVILGHRWWSLQELETTDRLILPRDLVQRMRSCNIN